MELPLNSQAGLLMAGIWKRDSCLSAGLVLSYAAAFISEHTELSQGFSTYRITTSVSRESCFFRPRLNALAELSMGLEKQWWKALTLGESLQPNRISLWAFCVPGSGKDSSLRGRQRAPSPQADDSPPARGGGQGY